MPTFITGTPSGVRKKESKERPEMLSRVNPSALGFTGIWSTLGSA